MGIGQAVKNADLAKENAALRRMNERLERELAEARETINRQAGVINRLPDWETFERMRDALKTIASYDTHSPYGEGVCPYGCDTPNIARAAMGEERN